MANKWKKSTWGEEISLEYGKALRDYKDSEGRYRVYGSNGPVGWTDTPIAPGPGVILGRKGAYRGVEYSREPFFVIDTAYYVKPKNELHMRWLYYAIVHHKLGEINDGSPIPSTTRAAVYVRDLEVPPPATQKAIAHILGTLDDKIELNRRMNETLEAMAAAVFKSWFVDFDPVIDKALAAGNPIPEELKEKATRRAALGDNRKPLPPEITALFPDTFQDSELGPIPTDWEAKTVSEIVAINPRLKLPKGRIAKYVDMKALPTKGFCISGYIEKEFKGGSKFTKNDILLARITPCLENGKTSLAYFLNDNEIGFGSTEFIILRHQKPFGYEFVYCLARDSDFRDHCIASMVGSSGRQRVQNDCFDHYKVAIPQKENLAIEFELRVQPLFNQIVENAGQLQLLAQLRDTLLPKLLNGEIELSLIP